MTIRESNVYQSLVTSRLPDYTIFTQEKPSKRSLRGSCISDSKHILAPQNEGDDKGQKDTNQDDADKAEGRLLKGDRDIDAPEAVDQGPHQLRN